MKVLRHLLKTMAVVAVSVGITVAGAATISAKQNKLTEDQATAKAEAALLAASVFGADWADGSSLVDQTFSELGREAGCSKADAAVLAGGPKRGLGAASSIVEKGQEQVNMDVAVYRDVKGAKGYMKQVRTPSFEACVVKADQLLAEKSFLPAKVTVTKTQEELSNLDVGDDAVGYHCTFDVQGDQTLTFEYYCYELRAGRAIASMGFPSSVPQDEQQRLLALLAANLKKA